MAFVFSLRAMASYLAEEEVVDYEEPAEFPALSRRPALKTVNDVAAPGEATCALKIEEVMTFAKELLANNPGASWISQIIELLDPSIWTATRGPVGWCGWAGKHMPRCPTDKKYKRNICDRLMLPNSRGQRMIRHARIDYEGSRHERCFMSYFQVPKDPGPPPTDRTIGNAQNLNAELHSVGGMQLAKLIQMFEAFREFQDPHIYLGDLASWFNQIPIPEGIKPLFSLLVDGLLLEYNTLVMGGQPSAKLAHGITCLWIIAAAKRIGLTIRDLGASAPPPVLRFWAGDSHAASVLPWIDNWCVIGSSLCVRDRFKSSMGSFCSPSSGWGLMLKKGSELSQPASEPFDFLGIRWVNRAGSVLWRHITGNLLEWRSLPHLTAGQTVTARFAAKLIGIITWDFSVIRAASGDTRSIGELAELLDISAKLAEGRLRRSDWDQLWTPSKSVADLINKVLTRILGPLPRTSAETLSEKDLDAHLNRSVRAPPRPPTKVVTAADASKTRGGHVRFDPAGRILDWCPFEYTDIHLQCADPEISAFRVSADLHINRLETICGILSISRTLSQLGSEAKNRDFMHAIDNSTARSALRLGRYPGCRVLTSLIQKLRAQIASLGSTLTILQVPSADMVADDPSRSDSQGKPVPPSSSRAIRCWASMCRGDIVDTRITPKRVRPVSP